MGTLKVFLCILTVFYSISCIRSDVHIGDGKILCSNIANHNDYILTDCKDLLGSGVTTSGVHTLNPDGFEPFQV